MSIPTQIALGDDPGLPAGVQATYYRNTRTLMLWGWYPMGPGTNKRHILNQEYRLGDFLRGLGLTARECKEALEE